MQKEHLKLYNINIKYIRDLTAVDDNVMSVSPQIGKENRPLVGVIVICDKKEYCVPLSSPKPKHDKMKNDLDFSKIIDRNGKLIGVLNFNSMLPVDRSLISEVDLSISKSDPSRLAEYKHLMRDQLKWCNENIDNIIKKANKLYRFVTLTPEKSYNLTRRCCDFKKLEGILEKWKQKEHQNDISHNKPYQQNNHPQSLNAQNSPKKRMSLDSRIADLHKNGKSSQNQAKQQSNKQNQPHKLKRSNNDIE